VVNGIGRSRGRAGLMDARLMASLSALHLAGLQPVKEPGAENPTAAAPHRAAQPAETDLPTQTGVGQAVQRSRGLLYAVDLVGVDAGRRRDGDVVVHAAPPRGRDSSHFCSSAALKYGRLFMITGFGKPGTFFIHSRKVSRPMPISRAAFVMFKRARF